MGSPNVLPASIFVLIHNNNFIWNTVKPEINVFWHISLRFMIFLDFKDLSWEAISQITISDPVLNADR